MITPSQIAASNSESAQQKALFAWTAIACRFGFETANAEQVPKSNSTLLVVPALQWIHSIPNGGLRSPITAGRMKAEGARSGIADIFLPFPVHPYHGLYIEMKKKEGNRTGKLSDEQTEFAAYCLRWNYDFRLCYTWREAANAVQEYLS